MCVYMSINYDAQVKTNIVRVPESKKEGVRGKRELAIVTDAQLHRLKACHGDH